MANKMNKLPPWLFAALFFLSAGYLLLTKIESADLWWHLACGRYFFENGSYPPTGTFTFSPVKPFPGSNALTWLGDLALFFIYQFSGGETGLQVLRVVAVCVPVWVFVRLSQNRTNTWTLLGALFIVMGTYQQNLLRNSIFALFFLPLMVLLWHTAVQHRNFRWLLPYPFILLAWTHMHGYALVGLWILALFFLGEVVDQGIRKESRNFRFLAILFAVLVCSWAIVNVNWHVNPLKILYNIQADILQKDMDKKTAFEKKDQKPKSAPHLSPLSDNWITSRFNTGKEYAKHLFRPFLKGGDADYVLEYVSPFDAYGILPAKTLFIFSFLYMGYLLCGFFFDRKGLKASYILPSLASIFLGLGYVRTLAFPFLIALPLMAAHLPGLVAALNSNKPPFVRWMRYITPWFAIITYFIVSLIFFTSSLRHFQNFFTGPVFMALSLICLAILLLTAVYRAQMYFRFSSFLLAFLPLIFCVQFAWASHYHFKEKKFYQLTQIFTREPGIGRNSKFRDAMPDYVLNKYPKENLFNAYGIGGFLLWKWYGQKKVFIDSRSIAYPKNFYEDYKINNGQTYLDRMDIDKAMSPITNGEKTNQTFMSKNWALICFDINAALWQRPSPGDLTSTFRVLPIFIGKPGDLDLLPVFELNALGNFINNTMLYMIFFGRLADTLNWTDQIQDLIQKLPDNHRQNIHEKLDLMNMFESHFGRINHPVIARTSRAMRSGDGSPASLNMIFGNAYQELNKKKQAARMYIAAAKLKPNDLDLQKKIGDLMFEMKFIDQAILQYRRVIQLTPEPVEEYTVLGYLYTIKKEYGQAEKYLRKMLAKLPDHPKTYENLGLVLAAKGDIEEAKTIFKKGLSILPKNQKLTQLLNDLEKKTK